MPNKIFSVVILCAVFIFVACRKKKDTPADIADDQLLPRVSSSPVTSVTDASALAGGAIVSEDESAITSAGICWDSVPGPTIGKSNVVEATPGTTNYTCAITGLSYYRKYYVRAYATNARGTSYGSEITFRSADIWSILPAAGILMPLRTIRSYNDRLFAISSAGVYASLNGGDSWALSGLTNTTVASVGVGSSAAYASQIDGVMSKSEDDGASWNRLTGYPFPNATALEIMVDGNTVYAGGGDSLRQSKDGGQSWSSIKKGYFPKILKGGSGIYALDSYAGTVLKTTDNGSTWQKLPQVLSTGTVNLRDMVVSGNNVIVTTQIYGAYILKDGDSEWKKVNDLPEALSGLAAYDSYVFCSSGLQFFFSSDSGLNWRQLSTKGIQSNFTPTSVYAARNMLFAYGLVNSTQVRVLCRYRL